MVGDRAYTVLLVSDNDADGELVQTALAGPGGARLQLQRVRRLSEAVERLAKRGVDAILLDLFLPDSQGIDTFEGLFWAAPLIPILLLVNVEDEEIAKTAIVLGAQDYLHRNHLDPYWLPRILRGLIERREVEEALFAEQERARVTLDSIGDAVLSTDIAGNVSYLNSVAEKLTGWSRDDAKGRSLAEVFRIVDDVTREPAPDPLALAVRLNKTVSLTANCILVRSNGTEVAIEDSAAPIHDRSGHIAGAVIVFRDVSAARSTTQRMAHLAYHDFLTDLPNRMLFMDRVSNAIALARRKGTQCAVLFLDLDGFKQINDQRGHGIGDELLISVAYRLVSHVRSSDTVSRQGGDEFAVLLTEIDDVAAAIAGAQKLLFAVAAPHLVAGEQLSITASIGISIYPVDGHDADTLISRADSAMYRAKRTGRNRCSVFKEE
ncbi:MAG: diguanylate cyclase [Dokdonella sp.]